MNRLIFLTALFFVMIVVTDKIYGMPGSLTGAETLEKIRNDFYLAVEDGDAADRLNDFIIGQFGEDAKGYPASILAYAGALEAVMAKHTYNPYSKVKYVIKGLDKLNEACRKDGSSLEVRFLRFSVLHNLPGFFGYRQELKEDLRIVYEQLKRQDYSYIDYELQKGIAEFLIDSQRLSKSQAAVLAKLFPDMNTRE